MSVSPPPVVGLTSVPAAPATPLPALPPSLPALPPLLPAEPAEPAVSPFGLLVAEQAESPVPSAIRPIPIQRKLFCMSISERGRWQSACPPAVPLSPSTLALIRGRSHTVA